MGIFNLKGVAVTALALGLVLSSCASDEEKAGNGGGASETTAAADNSGGGGGGGDAAAGKKLYESSCASCHGPDAKGLPNLGKDLTTSQFAIGLSDADLVAFIKKGRDTSDPANTTGVAMPPKGGNPALTDKQLASIVAYVRTLEK